MPTNTRFPLMYAFIATGTVLALACSSNDAGGPGPILQIEKHPLQSGDGQIWETGHIPPEPFVVQVTREGLPAEGVVVRWAPRAGSGATVFDSTVTDAAGASGTQWRLGITTGTHFLETTVDGAVGSPVVFTAVANPNLPFVLTIISGDGATVPVGGTQELVVRVDDEFGNPFPGATVFWSVVSGPGMLDTESRISNANGLALVEASVGPTTGTVIVNAWISATANHPTVFTLTVVP